MTEGTVMDARAPKAHLPQAIFIIRHGEKPPDGEIEAPSDAAAVPAAAASSDSATAGPPYGVDVDGNQNSDSLIPQGWQRAGGLASYFDPSDGTYASPVLARPTMIAVPEYGDPPKHRTYQTVWPLASKLGIEPTVTVAVGKETDLATWLLLQVGHTIVVCWEHKHIEDLTTALGSVISGGDIPGPWPGDRFDIVVALTADPDTSDRYLCTQLPELLLAGDSSEPIPTA